MDIATANWLQPRLARPNQDRTYGARRVWHDILAKGLSCGLHRVERLMRVHGLKARPRRRGLPKDEGQRSVIAGNSLDRQFAADRPTRSGRYLTNSTPYGASATEPA
jgi:transposase InsO family protein